MRTICCFLILAEVACLCSAQAVQESSPGASKLASVTSERSVNLNCSISIQKSEWDRQHPVQVAVLIQNRSQIELNPRIVPSLELTPLKPSEEPLKGGLSYLALWNIETGAPLAPSSTITLHLAPGDSKKVTSNIATLLWSRANWSVLPHSRLFRVVPAGRYSLRLELTGSDGKPLCSSKAVAVVIK